MWGMRSKYIRNLVHKLCTDEPETKPETELREKELSQFLGLYRSKLRLRYDKKKVTRIFY